MNHNQSFSQLPLSQEVLDNLKTLGYERMTPIQEKALPYILNGHDVIAQAKTGSGKTAAFGLGILNKLNVKDFATQALVLCPTRELAEQVCTELRRLARFTSNVKILSICGGASQFYQERSLEHSAPIIVGTPGRVQRLLKEGFIRLEHTKQFVLDEADRMLDMGFIEDIQNIANYLPKKRQTLLFSATFPEEILKLCESLQHEARRIMVDEKHEEHVIEQYFFKLETHREKEGALLKLLGHYAPKSSVVFCKTKQLCETVEHFLRDQGLEALAIHGDMEQRERTQVLTKFSNQSCNILVATDVAARGLDIKDLQAVINFDLTPDAEIYVHRIGRTGRAGKNGLALSLFVNEENEKVEAIEKYLGNSATVIDLTTFAQNSINLKPQMATLLIGGGKKDKVRPGDILGAITGDAGFKGEDVGNITILPTHSYVAVKATLLPDILKVLQNIRIKGRKFKIEKV